MKFFDETKCLFGVMVMMLWMRKPNIKLHEAERVGEGVLKDFSLIVCIQWGIYDLEIPRVLFGSMKFVWL